MTACLVRSSWSVAEAIGCSAGPGLAAMLTMPQLAASGNPFAVAVVAWMRTRLVIHNAMVRNRTPWQPPITAA